MKMSIIILLVLSITVCSNVVATDTDQMNLIGNLLNMMGGQQDKGQCDFLCPNDGEKSRNPKHVPSSNGCGSHGIKMDVSSMPGFEDCCNLHDLCYDTCGEDRKECDTKFDQCLKEKCEDIIEEAFVQGKRDQVRKKCRQLNHILYTGASSMGCTAYRMAQSNACLCDGEKVNLMSNGVYARKQKKKTKNSSLEESSISSGKESEESFEEENNISSEKEIEKSSEEESSISSGKESEESSEEDISKSSEKENDKASDDKSGKPSEEKSDKSSKDEMGTSSEKRVENASWEESGKYYGKESIEKFKGKESSKDHFTTKEKKGKKDTTKKSESKDIYAEEETEEELEDNDWIEYLGDGEDLTEEEKEMERVVEKLLLDAETKKKQKTMETLEKKDSGKIVKEDENRKDTNKSKQLRREEL